MHSNVSSMCAQVETTSSGQNSPGMPSVKHGPPAEQTRAFNYPCCNDIVNLALHMLLEDNMIFQKLVYNPKLKLMFWKLEKSLSQARECHTELETPLNRSTVANSGTGGSFEACKDVGQRLGIAPDVQGVQLPQASTASSQSMSEEKMRYCNFLETVNRYIR